MQNAPFVRVLYRASDLGHQSGDIEWRGTQFRRRLGQITAPYQLHGEIEPSLMLAPAHDGHDVRMIQLDLIGDFRGEQFGLLVGSSIPGQRGDAYQCNTSLIGEQ